MSSMQNTIGRDRPAPAAQATPRLTSALVLLLAIGAGVSVATIYVAQPMLGVLAAEFGAPAWLVGWVATLTQLGYAAGLLLLGPLADRHDRRRIILAKAVVLVVALPRWNGAACSMTASVDQNALKPTASSPCASAARRNSGWRCHRVRREASRSR